MGGSRRKSILDPKGRTINDWGGGQKWEKNSTATCMGKNSSAGWPGKKKPNTNSLPETPPQDH